MPAFVAKIWEDRADTYIISQLVCLKPMINATWWGWTFCSDSFTAFQELLAWENVWPTDFTLNNHHPSPKHTLLCGLVRNYFWASLICEQTSCPKIESSACFVKGTKQNNNFISLSPHAKTKDGKVQRRQKDYEVSWNGQRRVLKL